MGETVKDTAATGASAVKDTAATGASTVGSAAKSVGDVAKRAKTPLLAAGAAVAGIAGGLALRASANHRGGRLSSRSGVLSSLRKSLPGSSNGLSLQRGGGFKRGVRQVSKSVSEAAQRADQIGQQVSKAANTVQKVSDTANDAAKKS